jgi:hypothetical protein
LKPASILHAGTIGTQIARPVGVQFERREKKREEINQMAQAWSLQET